MSSPIFDDRQAVDRKVHAQDGTDGQNQDHPSLDTPAFEQGAESNRYQTTAEHYVELMQKTHELEDQLKTKAEQGQANEVEQLQEELKQTQEQLSELGKTLDQQAEQLLQQPEDQTQQAAPAEMEPEQSRNQETLDQFAKRQTKELQETPIAPSLDNLRTSAQRDNSQEQQQQQDLTQRRQ